MFVAKFLVAIGLLAIAGGIGIGLGLLEEKFNRMKLGEKIEKKYEKGPKYTKKGSIFARICKK